MCKLADVPPLPKVPTICDFIKDLRPISLTSTLSKVAEGIVIEKELKAGIGQRRLLGCHKFCELRLFDFGWNVCISCGLQMYSTYLLYWFLTSLSDFLIVGAFLDVSFTRYFRTCHQVRAAILDV